MKSHSPISPASLRAKLNTVTKARDELVALGRLAGYSGNEPEAAAVAIRSALAGREPAAAGARVSSPPQTRAEALWAQYHGLPIEKQHAFYKANRAEMGGSK